MNPVRLLLAAPLVLAATLLSALAWPAPPPAPPPAVAATVDPAVEALRAWDVRRAEAWAADDPAALRALYTDGSRTGRADVALLRAYVARGVAVNGMAMQLLAVDVVERDDDAATLVVTDRLVRVEAWHDGRALTLPADLPSTHRITLVRVGETWLVDEVVPGPQPAR